MKKRIDGADAIKSHLLFAVVSTICFFPPFGVAAIIYAAKTRARLVEGDNERAYICSKIAFAFCIASAIAGFIGLAFAVALFYIR